MRIRAPVLFFGVMWVTSKCVVSNSYCWVMTSTQIVSTFAIRVSDCVPPYVSWTEASPIGGLLLLGVVPHSSIELSNRSPWWSTLDVANDSNHCLWIYPLVIGCPFCQLCFVGAILREQRRIHKQWQVSRKCQRSKRILLQMTFNISCNPYSLCDPRCFCLAQSLVMI